MMADSGRPAGTTWLLALCVLLFSVSASAQSLDQRLLLDVADGELNEHDFISAAFISSGVFDRRELTRCRLAYEEVKLTAIDLPQTGSLNERLSALHAALHEHILVGSYDAKASDLRTTIARGDYNCLTALAIYWDLCHRSGLSLEIGARSGHVHLLLADNYVLEPSSRKTLALQRTNQNHKTRPLTGPQLLGKFYYNRGVEQLRLGNFEGGLALLQTSLKFDSADTDARENLAAGLNNWAVEHCRRKRYDLAAPLIAQGLAIDPDFAPLVANGRLVRDRLPGGK